MAKTHTQNARVSVSNCAGIMTGPIYQGEGCVAQGMGTEDSSGNMNADTESVKSSKAVSTTPLLFQCYYLKVVKK